MSAFKIGDPTLVVENGKTNSVYIAFHVCGIFSDRLTHNAYCSMLVKATNKGKLKLINTKTLGFDFENRSSHRVTRSCLAVYSRSFSKCVRS